MSSLTHTHTHRVVKMIYKELLLTNPSNIPLPLIETELAISATFKFNEPGGLHIYDDLCIRPIVQNYLH